MNPKTFQELYLKNVLNIVQNNKLIIKDCIFVLMGQCNLLQNSRSVENITDIDTFFIDGNEETFNKSWVSKTFTLLNGTNEYNFL